MPRSGSARLISDLDNNEKKVRTKETLAAEDSCTTGSSTCYVQYVGRWKECRHQDQYPIFRSGTQGFSGLTSQYLRATFPCLVADFLIEHWLQTGSLRQCSKITTATVTTASQGKTNDVDKKPLEELFTRWICKCNKKSRAIKHCWRDRSGRFDLSDLTMEYWWGFGVWQWQCEIT